jgi:hypothetical protein
MWMVILFNCLAALMLLGIAVLQFTKIWENGPHGKVIVAILVSSAGVCLIIPSIFQILEKKRSRNEQIERDKQLPGQIAEAITQHSSVEKITPLPVKEEPTVSFDRLAPHNQLHVAQENVFVADAVAMSIDDLKINLGHDLEFRNTFESVPAGKFPAFDARRTLLLRNPLIAARFIRAHLFPRSPFADMVKQVFVAAGNPEYDTQSDFLFDVYAVNITDNVTTIQDVIAEAEIDGKWTRLQRLDDLSDYEKVLRGSNNRDTIQSLSAFGKRLRMFRYAGGLDTRDGCALN